MSWRALTLHSKSRKNPVDDLLARIINLPAGLDVLVAVAAAGFSFVSAYVSNAPFVSLISALVALSFAFLAVNAILREVRWINYLAAKASPEILSAMNRKEFEVFLTILFRLNGYKIRSAVNDLHRQDDADWILNRKKETLLLQFNHFDEDSIGMQALQSLQKAATTVEASGAIAITTGHFLPEAKQWGDRKGLRLMTTDHLVEMAKQFMDTSSSLAAPHYSSSRKNGGSELKTKTPSECVLFVDFSGVSSGLEALNNFITSFPLTRLVATTLPPGTRIETHSSETGLTLIGVTEPHPSGRYYSIQRYLAQCPSGKQTPWVALDSEPQQFPSGCAELVVVNPSFGLNPSAIDRLERALSLCLHRSA